MSMINVILGIDAVHLVTDTAGLGLTGRVAGFRPKFSLLPHLGCAIAIRGRALHGESLSRALQTFRGGSVDDLLDGIGPHLRRSWNFGARFLPAWELFVAGWSKESGGPVAFWLGNTDLSAEAGYHAWVPTLIEDDIFAPLSGEGMFKRVTAFADPLRSMTAIAQIQRGYLGRTLYTGPTYPQVGGHVIVTRIGPTGIETSCIGSWPDDKVGARLEPTSQFVPARKPKERNRPSSILSGSFLG